MAPSRTGRSPAPSLRKPSPPSSKKAARRPDDYSSDGVQDNDVFLLPGSDFQILIGVTVLAAIVRLFRIYQPSSVVFDEVQYVVPLPPTPSLETPWHSLPPPASLLTPACI